MKETRYYNKIEFKDLGTSLKVLVIFGWVAFIFYLSAFLAGFFSALLGV